MPASLSFWQGNVLAYYKRRPPSHSITRPVK